MDNPKVTIITPSYNCDKYLDETIQSVLIQDYENIEYIVIDDASIDITELIAECYLPKITYVQNRINIGEQKTVNLGLQMVTGKYFMIVNADDPLLPNCVTEMVRAMESHPDVLCAYPDWISISASGFYKMWIKSRDYDFKYMVDHHTSLPSVGSMFRSSVIQTIGLRDTSYRWLGDFDYWFRIGLAGTMYHVPLTLACWRSRPGQASSDKSDLRAKEHIRIANQYFSDNHKAIAWSLLVAAAVTDSKINMIDYIDHAIYEYPQLLISLEFYHALLQRAKHIIKKRR